MSIGEIEWYGIDLLYLAQVKDKWWACTNTVMNLWWMPLAS
jgi:hypothetical protein